MVESSLVWARLSVQSPKHLARDAGKERRRRKQSGRGGQRGGGRERKNPLVESTLREENYTVPSSGLHTEYSCRAREVDGTKTTHVLKASFDKANVTV